MAKDSVISGASVIKLVSYYMSDEHTAFVKKSL